MYLAGEILDRVILSDSLEAERPSESFLTPYLSDPIGAESHS